MPERISFGGWGSYRRLVLRLKSLPARFLFVALFALLLGLRLLSPAGFMPSFEHGAVTIVACPDAGLAPAHHDHKKAKTAQPCPYAAASAFGTVNAEDVAIALVVAFAVAWVIAANTQTPSTSNWLRPPATGPPLLT